MPLFYKLCFNFAFYTYTIFAKITNEIEDVKIIIKKNRAIYFNK